MRLLFALLIGLSLSAQQLEIIAPDKRTDVTKFTYTDYPNKRTTWTLADTKGKVVVLAFLSEGFKACSQSLKELNGLQKQEKSQDLLVIPVYDIASRSAIDTTIGGLGEVNRSLTNVGVSSDRVEAALVGDGMFKNMPLSFRIYQEDKPFGHIELFPKFVKQPAIFIIDRQGRITSILWGYQKGEITKATQKILDEK